MPKLKSKSSAKKRFSFTGSGKVRRNHAGKNHFMRRRAKRMLRTTRGTTLMANVDARAVKKLLPYG